MREHTLTLSSLKDGEINEELLPYVQQLGFLNPQQVMTKAEGKGWIEMEDRKFKDDAFKQMTTESGIREMIASMRE